MKGDEIVRILTSPAFTFAVGTVCVVVLIRVGVTAYIELQNYELQKS